LRRDQHPEAVAAAAAAAAARCRFSVLAVNISRLHPKLRTIARNIPRAAAAIGFRARVTSGYRDPKKQAQLYNEYINGRSPYPVAPPGSSMHERGLAIDVVADDPDSLVLLLTRAGLSWAGPSDPVHFVLGGAPTASYAQKSAYGAWREGPGSSIPSFLGYLPIIGSLARTAADPQEELKFRGNQLLDVILGFL